MLELELLAVFTPSPSVPTPSPSTPRQAGILSCRMFQFNSQLLFLVSCAAYIWISFTRYFEICSLRRSSGFGIYHRWLLQHRTLRSWKLCSHFALHQVPDQLLSHLSSTNPSRSCPVHAQGYTNIFIQSALHKDLCFTSYWQPAVSSRRNYDWKGITVCEAIPLQVRSFPDTTSICNDL